MTAVDLINRLPPFSDKTKTVEDGLVAFGSWLRDDSDAQKQLSLEEREEIDYLTLSILKAYRHFLTGQIAHCYKEIYDTLFSNTYSQKIFCTQTVPTDSFFYRMRQTENDYILSKEELFHIPFDLRQKNANQRFSLTGYPCLYLGKSIYVCWEELNRPRFENANIVGLKTLRNLRLLDLRMPTDISGASDFYRLPLIIACAVKVQDSISPFKPEYIISQSLLHAIVTYNNSNYSQENLNGIIYYSSKINSDQLLFNDPNLLENIVVPTINNTQDKNAEKIYQEGYCPVLCNSFSITNPISSNTYQLTKNARAVYVFGGIDHSYSNTQMGILEEYIKRQNVHKILPNEFFRLRQELLDKY